MDEWIYFTPDQSRTYSINNFDDGNHKYQQYPNSWLLYGTWRGKLALMNVVSPEIRIMSISEWKTNFVYQDIGSGKYSSNNPE
jgi:hypothetical protein